MLVSIIVITYNSSQYVLETLDSAFRQTYKNIELIISDDCSTDNTIEICQHWIKEHKDRFLRTIITQTSTNGGICKNYNHATHIAQGQYLKFIAGDDVLCDNCIERFVANIQPNKYLYFCSAIRISHNGIICCFFHSVLPDGSAKKQLRTMLRDHPLVFGPCIFINRIQLISLGGFDEQYPMSEDYPILMKFLTHGHECVIIDEPLVQWRMHPNSTSVSNINNFKGSVAKSILYYSTRYCWRYGLFFTPYHDWVDLWIPKHYNKGMIFRIFGYMLRGFDSIHIKRKFFGYPPMVKETQRPTLLN